MAETQPANASVALRGVSKVFNLPGGKPLQVIEDVNLAVSEREFVSLLGPSGCGKSTLLRLVADILKPTTGDINILGLPPADARRRRLFSFMAQDPVMLPWRSVIQNVALPLEVVPDSKALRGRPNELLKLVGLGGFEDVSPNQLSGGMKQRAALARALLLNPRVLLMDEPFGALDEITREQMNLELLRIWRETEAAVIFVTHSLDEAVFLSDRIVVLSARPGRIAHVIEVNLPRPRRLEMKQSEEVFSLMARARMLLNEAAGQAAAANAPGVA